jgi:hypothetical protein
MVKCESTYSIRIGDMHNTECTSSVWSMSGLRGDDAAISWRHQKLHIPLVYMYILKILWDVQLSGARLPAWAL